MKHCSKCNQTKNFDEFYTRSNGVGYRPWCKDCFKSYTSSWTASNKKQKAKTTKEWQQNNKEKKYASNKRWVSKNKPHMNNLCATYRAKKRFATPKWANKEKIAFEYELASWCTKVMGVQYEVDHIVPINSKIVCGLHNEFNLMVIPAMANQSKGNRHWPDMPKGDFYAA